MRGCVGKTVWSFDNAFVTSRVDYCNGVLHRVSAANVQPYRTCPTLQLESYLRQRKLDHITIDVRDRPHWLPVQQRIEYKVCVLVYKCMHEAAPTYLTERCSPGSESANRGHLSSAARRDLVVPRTRTTRYDLRCYAVSGPSPLSVLDTS